MCVAIQIVGHKFHTTYVSIQERLTALMEATSHGHKNIVKALLDREADANITDEVGWCMHRARSADQSRHYSENNMYILRL
jgi:ankyrin repeat protein